MNQRKFRQTLEKHKKLIASYNNNPRESILTPIDKTAEELVIALAEAKCEKCKAEENLQIHHIWQRINQHYTNKHKYIAQRHYWANQILLCEKCHAKIEKRGIIKTSKSISKKKITEIKKLYEIKD